MLLLFTVVRNRLIRVVTLLLSGILLLGVRLDVVEVVECTDVIRLHRVLSVRIIVVNLLELVSRLVILMLVRIVVEARLVMGMVRLARSVSCLRRVTVVCGQVNRIRQRGMRVVTLVVARFLLFSCSLTTLLTRFGILSAFSTEIRFIRRVGLALRSAMLRGWARGVGYGTFDRLMMRLILA